MSTKCRIKNNLEFKESVTSVRTEAYFYDPQKLHEVSRDPPLCTRTLINRINLWSFVSPAHLVHLHAQVSDARQGPEWSPGVYTLNSWRPTGHKHTLLASL